MQGYKCLCENWRSPQDEIFLTGFSRGAFTARVLILLDSASLDEGILNKIRDKWAAQANGIWTKHNGHERQEMMQDLQKELSTMGKRCYANIRVKACGLWDSCRP
jgi:uncharacterized protein (DUF2235 family)